jgi:hypothetical protein
MGRILRVFPRRTAATPTDPLAFVGRPPFPSMIPECDGVHVSVAFTYDLPEAEALVKEWDVAGVPVSVGGPALNAIGGDFTPGLYVRDGYTITSRGCPNYCWFCSVPKREGGIRELPIRDGHDVLDSNLLACSDAHIRAVFAMLARQKRRARFTGGFEARLLRDWHVDALGALNAECVFVAYDTADDYEPLRIASGILKRGAWFRPLRNVGCYCLIGYPRDTFDAAESRLRAAVTLGFMPMAMLYRDERGETSRDWRVFAREWARPAIIKARLKPEPPANPVKD